MVFWTFSFFANLRGECVLRNEYAVILRREDGGYEAVLWNLPGENKEPLNLSLSFPLDGDTTAMLELVDEETCNPLACWHRMGEPADLTGEQLAFLRAAGQPAVKTLTPERCGEGAGVTLTLAPNAVARLRIVPIRQSADPGYDYSWYCGE